MYQPEKLKIRRKELKLTQKDIADRLGIVIKLILHGNVE